MADDGRKAAGRYDQKMSNGFTKINLTKLQQKEYTDKQQKN